MRQRQTDSRGHEGREGRADRQPRPAARTSSPVPLTAEGMTPAGLRAMNDAAGNGAVNRVLSVQRAGGSGSGRHSRPEGSGSGRHSRPEGSGSGRHSRRDAPARRDPKDVMKDIKSEVDGPPLVNYGARRQGRAHEEFWMRFPRFKDGEEAEETTHETSALLFDSMKGAQERARQEEPDGGAEDANNREVQGMLINDRLVFASNFNSSVDTLVSQGRQVYGHEPSLQELLAFQQSQEGRRRGLHAYEAENLEAKLASYRRKNAAIVSGQRGAGEQGRGPDPAAKVLQAQLNSPVIVVDVEDKNLHTMLTSPKYAGRVFLLRFAQLDPRAKKQGKNRGEMKQEESVHAEQKLLIALSHAGVTPGQAATKPLVIMGKYRPCMGCAAALTYYRDQMGFGNLSFDENYGHYFQGSVNSLHTHLEHIMDDDYLAHIKQMVRNDITSTPAMAHEAAPAGAGHRRRGPTLRVPGRLAARQADVTPVASDAEFDEDGTYTRVARPLQDTWTVDTAPAGIGKGTATHQVPRRRTDKLSADQADQLHGLWNGGAGAGATNESRQQAIELLFNYHRSSTMSLKHLGSAVDLSENRLGTYLTRYEKEGHWTHTPQRSNKPARGAASTTTATSRKKGAVEKQFSKGRPLDRAGKDTIKAAIRGLSGNAWCADWERRHSGRSSSDLNPTKAPLDLLATLARLRRDDNYSVSEMSAYLHTGSNGDNLRKALNRKGKERLAQIEGDSGAASSAQADQYAAPAPAQADHYAASSSQADYYQAGSSSGAGYYAADSSSQAGHYGGESSATGAGYQPQVPEVPGSTLHLDPFGQAIYVEDDTGHHYILVGGRMVRFQTSVDAGDVRMSDY
ncbi:hypothetical protein [Streptomyces alboflavus]|uniref:hypothetical protein n=1 Tax=Streptomyces alboflavus TaxID=67267 RepID=UPI000F658A3C|nr:hypothetical protein [Streptomyces alboflavus]